MEVYTSSTYPLDLSSVFMASALNELPPSQTRTIIDLCASPGGKSIYAWRLLQPDILISNEVIGKRLPAIISNFKRLNIAPSFITTADVSYFTKFYNNSADVVIVDAPCSGQSLLEKGQGYNSAFSPHVIKMNQSRQKKIISKAAEVVAPQRWLAYMTCTFSEQENEKVCQWFMKKFPHFEPQVVTCLEPHRSKLADFPCYRLSPEDNLGAGGFTVLFKNLEEGEKNEVDVGEIRCVWKNENMERRAPARLLE